MRILCIIFFLQKAARERIEEGQNSITLSSNDNFPETDIFDLGHMGMTPFGMFTLYTLGRLNVHFVTGPLEHSLSGRWRLKCSNSTH